MTGSVSTEAITARIQRGSRSLLPAVRWTARADIVLIITVWAGILVPQLVASIATGKGFVPITTATPVPPGVVASVTTVANVVIMIVCATVVLTRLRALGRRPSTALLLVLLPWSIAAAYLVVAGRAPGAPALIFPAVAIAFWAVRPRPDAVQTVGYLTGVTAAASLVLGALLPDAGRYPGESAVADKAVGALGILSGVMPTGNNLGLFLVLGLPTVLTIRGRQPRSAALAVVLLALTWTTSRTSWAAAAVVVLLLAALAVLRRPALVAAAGLAVLAAVGIVLPFVPLAPTAFTNRASYWASLLDSWQDRMLAGFGADFFERLAQTPENLGGYAYHAHNQWVQLLVTGGLLLLLAAGSILAVASVRAVRRVAGGDPWGAGWLAAVLAVAVLEVPLGFVDRAMFWPVVLVPLCLLLFGDQSRPLLRVGLSATPALRASRLGGPRG